MTFYKNNIISKSIVGQTKTSDYNIYENKLMDIDSIKFTDYIDDGSRFPTSVLDITGIVNNNSCKMYAIYANPEHVHYLISRAPNLSEEKIANKKDGT